MTPRRVLTRHARRAVLGAALVAGGCTFQPADPPSGGPATAVRGDEIIGGGPAADDDAVVLLASFPTDRSVLATCSAVAISPTVLLTAAHCVDAGTHPGYIFGAFLGADASAYPTLVELEPHLVAITEVHAHPSYATTAPYPADIGVAILAEPLTGVTPVGIRRTALTAADVGQPARIVGYGQAVVGTPSSTRRQATTVIDGLDPDDTVRVGDATHLTCVGDSGGPALYDGGAGEVVIGIDSYADNGNCDLPAHFRRTDVYQAFLDQYTGDAPDPGPDAGAGGAIDAAPGGGGGTDDGGGCAAGGRGGAAWLPLAAALGLAARRRRRHARR